MERLACGLVLALALVGCGDDDGPADGGRDAGTLDATTDTGATDSGGEDAGDSGADDAGSGDGGGEDAATDGGADAGGCTSNDACAASDYCAGASCDEPGTCEMRPEFCTDIFDPVCGCDGVTYGNACEAASAGVRVASAGACSPTPDCRSNDECAGGDYCAAEACDGPGMCEPRPEACLDIYDPVCGCDDRTYGNACEAAAAGMRVAATGECAVVMCDLRPRALCCYDDGDCRGRDTVCRSATCTAGLEGTCVETPTAGACWADSDCGARETCEGENQCPCGAFCLLPDSPGRCVARL